MAAAFGASAAETQPCTNSLSVLQITYREARPPRTPAVVAGGANGGVRVQPVARPRSAGTLPPTCGAHAGGADHRRPGTATRARRPQVHANAANAASAASAADTTGVAGAMGGPRQAWSEVWTDDGGS